MTTDLERFDTDFTPQVAIPAPPPGTLHNGYHTITYPDGSHRTVRIHTQKEHATFAPGERIISLLTGPDNRSDYEQFGFVKGDGRVIVWKKHRGEEGRPSRREELVVILMRLVHGDVPGYELHESRHCRKCNKVLTDPESIAVGLGPTCRGER